jgi:hypothetical protein
MKGQKVKEEEKKRQGEGGEDKKEETDGDSFMQK